jgi:exodeoxyribonuclease V alpha subunit
MSSQVITGSVKEMIFRNPDSGYTVAEILPDGENETVTAVGYLLQVECGQSVRLIGSWKQHPVYGKQFAASAAETLMPQSAAGIEDFLASGLLKGIGRKTAAALVAYFGDKTLEVIETQAERLTEVDGIGPVKAAAISEAFQAHKELAAVILYFQQNDIPSNYALKFYRAYGDETIARIEENPYRLIKEVQGVGFRTADQIASRLGMAADSPERLRSAARYRLWAYVNEGHVFVPVRELCEATAQMIEQPSEEIREQLVELAFAGEIRIENLENRPVVYPMVYYIAEQVVSGKLADLADAPLDPIPGEPDSLVERAASDMALTLSEDQRLAIRTALLNGVTVITGGPGTGKTTIINVIMKILQEARLETAICAPTGRAAKRITETWGYEAKTVHRLLEYSFADSDETMFFGRNRDNPLEVDAVIVDEASMIDILLMKGLLEAIPAGARLIIIGDADQLPSVGPGNVLRDILESEWIPAVHLKEIFRQAGESLIVVNAHRINRGEHPDCNQPDRDFFLLRRPTERDMQSSILDLCQRRLPAYYVDIEPFRDIQVLTPVRKGPIGVRELNRELQALLNPPKAGKNERKTGERIFREGDKVMQIRNNYEIEWRKTDDFSEGCGVFNGDFGVVHTVDNEGGELTVCFDDNRFVRYDSTTLEELELAYAITVHKSQGSEFPVVVMPVSWFPPVLATRNLLYTAVTRAKEAVVLVGSEDRLRQMVDNNQTTRRYSGLATRLKRFLEC